VVSDGHVENGGQNALESFDDGVASADARGERALERHVRRERNIHELAGSQRREVSLDNVDRDIRRHVEFPRDAVRILERDVPPLENGVERQAGRRDTCGVEPSRNVFELGLASACERDVIETDTEGIEPIAARRPRVRTAHGDSRAAGERDEQFRRFEHDRETERVPVKCAGASETGRAERDMVNAGRLQGNRHSGLLSDSETIGRRARPGP
jgi:hypothetical protein